MIWKAGFIFVLINVASAGVYECNEDERLFPDAFNCAGYLQCVHGSFMPRPCGPGTHFNPRLEVTSFKIKSNFTDLKETISFQQAAM